MTTSRRSLRILHVLHSYRLGGMENMVAQMAERLGEMNFTIAICALTVSDSFRSRLPSNVCLYELQKRPGLDFRCVIELRRLVRKLDVDVVHSHNWSGLVYSVAALAGSSTPLLHGEHAELYSWERTGWRLKLRQALYCRCDAVHTVSRVQASGLDQLGILPERNVQVICNGVESTHFHPGSKSDARRVLGVPVNGRCIGVAARFVPEKRHQLLLGAFDKLGELIPDISLLLAGDGGCCEHEIKLIADSHRFSKQIHWLGRYDNMAVVYNALDLVVIASTAEGMSNVCLEAMSCGVPVLRHQASGFDELIEDGRNGFVRDLSDCDALVSAVTEVLASASLLEATGAAARKSIEHEYRLDETADKYAELYRFVSGKIIQSSN